jgi:hypothetical protein
MCTLESITNNTRKAVGPAKSDPQRFTVVWPWSSSCTVQSNAHCLVLSWLFSFFLFPKVENVPKIGLWFGLETNVNGGRRKAK